MCGNGIRCVAKYVYDHGICRKDTLADRDRPRRAHARAWKSPTARCERVRVDMGEPILEPAADPHHAAGQSAVVNAELPGRRRGTLARHLRLDGQSALRHVRRRARPTDWVLRRRAAGRDRSAFPAARQRRVRRGALARRGPDAGLGARLRRDAGLRHRRLRRLRGRRADRPHRAARSSPICPAATWNWSGPTTTTST